MATAYLSPGVYVEEVDKGSKPIEGVGTAMAAFVGFAEKLPMKKIEGSEELEPVKGPVLIANWTQFQESFGGFLKGSYLAHAVYGYFLNGGGSCYVNAVPVAVPTEETKPMPAVALLTAGETPKEILSVSALEPGAAAGEISVEVTKATGEGAPEDQFRFVVRVGTEEKEAFDNLSLKKGKGVRNVADAVNKESKLIKVMLATGRLSEEERVMRPGTYKLTVPKTTAMAARDITPLIKEMRPDAIIGDATERTGVNGFQVADDVTMVCAPDLMALFEAGAIDRTQLKAAQLAVLAHCENMKDRFAILDCPPGMSPQEIKNWRVNEAGYDSKYGAVYYPCIKVANPLGNGGMVKIPPCGHIAGIYSRSDNERGVHKAPANEVVRGAVELETRITKAEQDSLNPQNINCIRAFPGRGIRIWGARTVSSDPSWRYINVRRLFNYIEKSIERGTQWIVFEPNDMDLWARIRRDITAFLTRVWRDGALFGATAAEAFYVKCDAELNTAAVRDAGQVIIEIGLAPVKPAEFVIFRISQWAGGGEVKE